MHTPFYNTLFLDIGGVILSNGWDRTLRERASQKFNLDLIELNKRHALTFDTYEIGKITLDVYLDRTVFYMPRNFSKEEFKDFMFSQPQAHLDMIQLIRDIKARYSLRVVAVSNEGRELMVERIKRFHLKEFIDFFVCSGFIGLRKPDEDIYRIALDLAQANPQEVIYIDDRPLLAEIGSQLGMQTIQHQSFQQTQNFLKEFFVNHPHRKDQ